jgi:antirestriction protein ArdC
MVYIRKHYKSSSDGATPKFGGEAAVERFTEMMIDRMQQMKASDWKQGWIDGKGTVGLPQNLSGRNYSGTNSFFLQLDSAQKGYEAPVYMTYLQVSKEGAHVLKGEQSIPVIYWDLNIKDASGHRVGIDEYRNMTPAEQASMDVRPFLRAYNVFNLQQTNLAEVNKEKYDAAVNRFKVPQLRDRKGMYENRALDRMFERQEWICPIQNDVIVDGACYSPTRDLIILPRKEQFNIGKNAEEVFKDGMEYYSSALHEMTHSTGTPGRLNRDKGSRFGDAKYAKEELVAELTAAMVGNTLGFDKRILNNNAAYLDGWIAALREDPKFIVSVMADVNKASRMIIGRIDDQKLALGEEPLLAKHRQEGKDNSVEKGETIAAKARPAGRRTAGIPAEPAPTEKSPTQDQTLVLSKFSEVSVYKKKDGTFAVRAAYDGNRLDTKPVPRFMAADYLYIKTGHVRREVLEDILRTCYTPEDILTARPQRSKGLGL